MTFAASRRCLVLAAAVLPGAGLGGCARMFVPHSIDISAAQLQEGMARNFPLARRLGNDLDLGIGVPRLTLLPDANRIAIEAELSGGGRLLERPLTGSLAVSQRLIFDPADHAVHGIDVQIDRLQVDGLGAALAGLARPLVRRLLERQPLYTLRPRDIERMQAAGVVPGDIRVTASGITVALVPASP